MSTRVLVLYYSRTGNTEAVAKAMADELKADVEVLGDPVSYAGPLGYVLGGRDALKGRVAEIDALPKNPADYDLIVIGQPVWAGRPVPAVNGFAKRYSLKDKTVALFVTFDGGGDTGCLTRTAALFPGARLSATRSFLRVRRNRVRCEADARAWAKTLG